MVLTQPQYAFQQDTNGQFRQEVVQQPLIQFNSNENLKRNIYPIQLHFRHQCWEAERTFSRREDRSFGGVNMRMQASRLVFKVHYSDTEEVEDNNLAEAVQYEPRGHLKKKVKFFDARGQQSPPVVAEGCWNCKQKEHCLF